MAVVIPTGFAHVSFLMSLTGDPELMSVTCGFNVVGAVEGPQQLCDAFAGFWLTAFPANETQANWQFRGTRMLVGDEPNSPISYETTLLIPGTSEGTNTLPQNCAYLVRKQTASAGRANRGRFYLPQFLGQEVDVSSTGMLSAAALASIQSKLDGLFADFATVPPVILHDEFSPVTTPTPVTGFALQPQIATQRRRLRR